MNVLNLPHIICSQQFNRQWLEGIFFPLASQMADMLVLETKRGDLRSIRERMSGKGIISLFYESSTRTRTSFELAMQNIGGRVVAHTENARKFSSAVKGETTEDTVRVLSSYCLPWKDHAIVMRHNETGAALIAAQNSPVPIINAGDGAGQHPTQALLDIFTIWEKFQKINGLKIAMVGDLKNGRTVRSLCYLLSKFSDVEIFFVAPDEVKMEDDIKKHLTEHNIKFSEISDLNEISGMVDVIYTTRIQRERPGCALVDYDATKFSITERILDRLRQDCIIMHPLPRNPADGELPTFVDGHRSAWYFKQAQNGLFTRMALLYLVFLEPAKIPAIAA